MASVKTLLLHTGILYKAPEILRAMDSGLHGGSQKADSYAFGLILYEMHGRMGPWGLCPLMPKGEIHSRTVSQRILTDAKK